LLILIDVFALGTTIKIHWRKWRWPLKTLAEIIYFFTRATLCIGDLKFGAMEFGEMKRNALSMPFLADRTNGRAIGTVLRPSS